MFISINHSQVELIFLILILMALSGTDFETLVKPFFKKLFEEMGFFVYEIRNQWSGTQNGFDIKIECEDETGTARNIFIECKYYESKLDWSEILNKQMELSGSNYSCDCFIALSPKVNLSNINDNLQKAFESFSKHPAEFWTPDNEVEEMFSIDQVLYKNIYGKPCSLNISREEQIVKIKRKINLLLKKKDALKFANIIRIEETNKEPNEDGNYKTNLDKKLDAILDTNHEDRIRYHQLRCDYKIYLEELQDINNILRTNITNWQDDLRLKAKRLTGKFNIDNTYTAEKFFHDFFDAAEDSLNKFYSAHELNGDTEKLLHGVVFELAAECPLDWRKPDAR
jgi:hypothetical protein